MYFWLALTGLAAGIIDAIAGGGGLITLPVWAFYLGPGAIAVGTNKIVGTLASLTALLVYARKTTIPWKKAAIYLASIAFGSFLGSRAGPLLPKQYFYYLMIFICPLILALIWKRDALLDERKPRTHGLFGFVLGGILCGFYDGFFGPGGGTFMFLALLFLTNLTLFESLAVSKLANTISASVALVSYYQQGYVRVPEGICMGLGISAGAFLGAHLASKRAINIVRPVLLFIITLIFIRVLKEVW